MYNKVAKRGDAELYVAGLRNKEFTIWTNVSQDIDDWDFETFEDERMLTEEEKWEIVDALSIEYLEDERANLNVTVDDGLIAIASLGLWDGRAMGFKEIGTNLSDILYSDENTVEWYVDKYKNVRGYMEHHDGTNYVLYRAWKHDITESQKDRFKTKIILGLATSDDIRRYTKSIGDIVFSRY